MIKMDDEIGFQQSTSSRFNSATDILQMISMLKFEANKLYEKGDLEAWFYKWKAIKFQMIGKLATDSPEELKKLELLEAKIARLLSKGEKSQGYRMVITKLIESYLLVLQKKQQEWEMGLVNKSNETSFA